MWSEIIIHTCTCTVSNPETVCTRFFGVTSENLNSILRRTLVVKFRAVFHDQFYIAAHAVEPEKHGIFVRDPTLKDFLKSGPACLATLRVLWQFAGMYSAEECRQVLEDYVMNGGDDGLTEACVRIACNLPAQDGAKPKDDRALNTQQAAAAEDPKQAVQLQQQEELQRQFVEIVGWMLEERREWLTVSRLQKAKKRFVHVNKAKAAAVLGSLRDTNLFLQHEQTLPKVGKVATFSPVVDTQASFSECVQLEQDKDLVFQECWNWQNVKEAVAEVSPRVMNRVSLQQHLAEVGKEAKQAGPGRRSADAQHRQGKNKKETEQLNASTKIERAIAEEVAEASSSGSDVVLQRGYRYLLENLRTRRIVCEAGAQSMSRCFRRLACTNMRDYDIKSCMFSLVVQLYWSTKPCPNFRCRQQSLQAGARLLQIAARCAPASCACQSLKASSFLSKSPTERPRPHWRAKAPKTFSSVYLQRVAFSGRHCPWSKSKPARHVAIPRYSMVVVIGVVMVLALALARCWCWCWRGCWWW